jgi:hypothetical protein
MVEPMIDMRTCETRRRFERQAHGWEQGGGIGLALTSEISAGACWGSRRTVDESLGQDWEQETASLSRTSLSTSHQVSATHDDWDGILLNWCWNLVVSELDVFEEMVVKRRVCELEDRLGDIVTRGFDGDIIVLLEVDASLLLGWIVCHAEKFPLQTCVGRSSDMLAISPGSVTATTSRDISTASATSSSRVSICISVEGWSGSDSVPRWTCSRRAASTRSEVWSVGPVSATSVVTTNSTVSVWGRTLACHQ